jgi:TPR repeat protein
MAYNNGTGVKKDLVEALAWYELSAQSGLEVAIKNRERLAGYLGSQATAKARKRSEELRDPIEVSKVEPIKSKVY